MRKDVILGMTIGGVMLAIIVIYLTVSPGNKANRHTVETAGAFTESGSGDSGGGSTQAGPDTTEIKPAATDKAAEVKPAPVAKPANSKGVKPELKSEPAPIRRQILAATSEERRDPVWGSRLWSDSSVAVSETPDPNAARTADHESAGDQSAAVASAEPKVVVVPPASAGNTEPAAAKPPVSTSATGGQVATPAATGSGKVHVHVVQKNETFSSIANSVYGSPSFYPHLLRANPNVDPAKLKPGMPINVPDAADVKPPEKPAADAGSGTGEKATLLAATTATHRAEPTVDARTEYRVQSGDSLHKIAVKLYGKIDMVEKIYQLNKSTIGDNPAKLKLGMVLKLPEPPVAKQQ